MNNNIVKDLRIVELEISGYVLWVISTLHILKNLTYGTCSHEETCARRGASKYERRSDRWVPLRRKLDPNEAAEG